MAERARSPKEGTPMQMNMLGRFALPEPDEAAVELPAQVPAPPTAESIFLRRAAAAVSPVVPGRPAFYTVRQLIAELRQHVEGSYARLLTVEGEVSNCRSAPSGHLYFTLKDGDAQLPVVMFRRQAQMLSVPPKDGLAVELRGRVAVYESRGQLQLIAESVRARGAGALQFAFEQLRDRLRREGLFDRERNALPAFPHCIGVVTSPHGAAIRDIVQIVRRRHARLNLLIYPAPMQGPQCAATVAAGVRWFNRNAERVDVIVIARGGGSLEDLAGFNDEALARTIAASRLPVVAAIGHEVDHTIADYVADLRAPTPSAAAELITAAQHRIEERVDALSLRVRRAGAFHLLAARRRLERLSADHVLDRLRDSVELRAQRVDELRARMTAAAERRTRLRGNRLAALELRLRRADPALRLTLAARRLAEAQGALERTGRTLTATRLRRLEHAGLRLEALSPLAVLARGYALLHGPGGAILRRAADAPQGSEITARVAEGSLRAIVLETHST